MTKKWQCDIPNNNGTFVDKLGIVHFFVDKHYFLHYFQGLFSVLDFYIFDLRRIHTHPCILIDELSLFFYQQLRFIVFIQN